MSIKSIIPLPVHLTERAGSFPLTDTTAILATGAAQRHRAAARLCTGAGARLPPVRRSRSGGPGQRDLATSGPGAGRAAGPRRLPADGRRDCVEIGGRGGRAVLRRAVAPAAAAGRHLPRRPVERAAQAGRSPRSRSRTSPRFGWRGVHLDVGRHFMPKAFVKKFIDLLALHKLNTLPLAPDRRPGLAHRDQELPEADRGRRVAQGDRGGPLEPQRSRSTYDGKPHGGFYTQDDVREIVAYAARAPHHRRAGDRDARPRAGGDRRLSRSSAAPSAAARGEPRLGRHRERLQRRTRARSGSCRTCSTR